MTARNLFDLLHDPIANHADDIAIAAPDGQEISYRRLGQTIARFSRKARDESVAPGQLVAINITHPAAIICMIAALSRIGAVAVIGDQPRQMTEAGVKLDAVISDSMDYDTHPGTIRFDQSWAATSDETLDITDESARSADELALICASSGSTGERKFFTLTFATQIERLTLQDRMHGLHNDRRLITPGMSALWGFQNGFRTLRSGGLLLLPAGNAHRTMDEVERHAISEIMTTPNLLIDLINARRDSHTLTHLKRVIVGGSQTSLALIDKAKARLCPDIISAYGATETGPTVYGTLEAIGGKPNAVGRVAPWVEMRVLSPEDQVLPPRESGRIQIRVPAAFRPSSTITRSGISSPYDEDGWFEPGDLGWLEDGVLFIEGRSTDVINVGGNKLSAHQLEELIAKAPGVVNSAVLGQTNAAGFDTVCVGLVTDPHFVPVHFDNWLSDRIGKLTPRKFLTLAEFPLLASGKVDKPKLKALFADVSDYGTRALTD